jgi:hypothetical protein
MTFSGILAWLTTNEGTTIALLTFAGVAIIALIFTMPWKGAAVTPEQCRQARRLMGWSRERLGAMSGAPEQAGVVFTNGDEPGVKLKKVTE